MMNCMVQQKQKKEAIVFKMHNTTAADFYMTDQKRLYQCLYNMLENAFKFTTEGEITLVCKVNEIGNYIDL